MFTRKLMAGTRTFESDILQIDLRLVGILNHFPDNAPITPSHSLPATPISLPRPTPFPGFQRHCRMRREFYNLIF